MSVLKIGKRVNQDMYMIVVAEKSNNAKGQKRGGTRESSGFA